MSLTIKLTCVLPLLGLLAGFSAVLEAAETRPNILVCIADDWGWPHAGAYGDLVVKTPAFDRIGAEGALFHHAYISSPSCTPSRNAILTGQQFYRLEEGANLRGALHTRFPNFMFLLRDSGYQIGHWRKAWGPGEIKQGGYTEHPCGPEGSFASFFEERDKTKPFCFWFGTSDPHRSYDQGSGVKAGIDPQQIELPAFYPDLKEIREDIADYYFEVQRWDNDVAKALELLEQAGELDNTIVVMTGDHGMPFPRCKGNLYDWGARVPLAIRWGGKVSPRAPVNRFVSLTDLAPTFLEAAGIPVPHEITGRSLLPALTGKAESNDNPRDFVVFGRERHTPAQKMPSVDGYPSRAIRTDRWLLILNQEPDRWPAGIPQGATHPMDAFSDCDKGPTKTALMALGDDATNGKFYELSFAKRPAIELYDSHADPDQTINLAGKPEHEKTVATLRKKLTDYLAATGDPRFTDDPIRFDQYPYHAGYMAKRLQEHQSK
jgi:N-sulfoglucosamine sulfohydrolase